MKNDRTYYVLFQRNKEMLKYFFKVLQHARIICEANELHTTSYDY